MKGKFPPLTTKSDTKYNAQMFDLDEIELALDRAHTGVENMPRQKKRKIFDPRKSADTRFAGDTNLLQHKRRTSQRERVDASRTVPLFIMSTKQTVNRNP